MPIFTELSIILVLATGIAIVMRFLKQPLIVGYILAGIIVGPYFLNLLHSKDEMEFFSKIGISILLFIVGLTLNPDIAKEVGKASVVTGLGQVFFTAGVGFFVVKALGFDISASIYIALALTFSSTIIILKLLTDRGDTGKLYGKISIGFLLVQDLFATIILLIVTTIGAKGGTSTASTEFISIIVTGAIIAVSLYIISKYLLPKLVKYVGGNQEVLFIFSVAWGLGLASLFHFIGFSIEIGALVAGVMLATSPFAYEIGARMKPLRDFFILIFFILLGAQMVFSQLSLLIVPALLLSAFVLIGNPLIVFFLMNILGYRNKTSFMAGLTVAQISEFSLILVTLGYSLGHISQDVVSLVTIVGVITIAGSTYLILYADSLYVLLRNTLKKIAPRKHSHRENADQLESADIVIFGYDRVGHEFVSAIEGMSTNFFVVDYSPQSIQRLAGLSIPFRYGDAEDVEFLGELGLQNVKLVISSIPDHKTNLVLVKTYRSCNPSGVIIVIAHSVLDAEELYSSGASYVVMPHHLGAHHAALMISRHGFDPLRFKEEREAHLARLSKQQDTDKRSSGGSRRIRVHSNL
jgi:Kef-type K+ transport system membrane component KefB/Trk K+ transport system NAD-binding subunit